MLAEVGVPVVAAIFCEITAPLFGLMIAAFFAHEATALWDVTYADARHHVTPLEQHVHSFLEIVPLLAMLLAAIPHWPQFLALFGRGEEPADFRLRPKEWPLPPAYAPAVAGSLLLFETVPYLEELWSCLRHETRLPPAR